MTALVKSFLQVFAICALAFVSTDSAIVPGCAWDLNTDIPESDPIYFTTGTIPSVVVPTGNGLLLAPNEQMLLVCPSKANTIFGTGLQELIVSCTSDNMVLYDGVKLPLKSLECSNNTLSDVVQTKLACANGAGELMYLGFNSSKGMARMVEVCYNKINEAVIFAVNMLYGKALPIAEIENNRPQFRNQGLSYGTANANLYKQTEQMIRFTALLGASQAQKYLTTTSFLARGHLAPDGDFLFGSWSTATYFLVNAAPEWQVINAGNWLVVENTARQIATKRQEDLVVITGVSGVSQLPDGDGNMTNLYLMAGNKLPVPKWYWKIVFAPSNQQGIAFVTLNNPHVNYINESEFLCKNICAEVGFGKPEWVNYAKGYTYCCDVNDLIDGIGTLPRIQILGRITNL